MLRNVGTQDVFEGWIPMPAALHAELLAQPARATIVSSRPSSLRMSGRFAPSFEPQAAA